MTNTSDENMNPSFAESALFRRCVYGFLGIVFALLAASIPDYRYDNDEAYAGEYAYFIAVDGYPHSALYRGFYRQDEYVAGYHKLQVWLGAVLVKLFGWDLFVLRLVSLCSGFAALWMFWHYALRERLHGAVNNTINDIPDNKRHHFATFTKAAVAVLIWLLMPEFFQHFKIYRATMLAVCMGFASYYWLWKAHRSSSLAHVLAAGIFAGLSMLSHLNGSIYAAAGGIVLLLHRRWAHCLVFSLAAILVFSPYIIDAWLHWDVFITQLRAPAVGGKTQIEGWWTPLVNLSREHQRLFRKPQTIIPSALWIVSLLLLWRLHRTGNTPFRAEQRFLLRYTALLIGLLGALMSDKRTDYMQYYFPFMALLCADACWQLVWRGGKLWHTERLSGSLYALVFMGFIGYGIWWQTHEILFEKEPVRTTNTAIQSHIPRGAQVLAPMNFIYNQLPSYTIICLDVPAFERTGNILGKNTVQSIAHYCATQNIDYLVLNAFTGDGRNPENFYAEWIEQYDSHRAELFSAFEPICVSSNYAVFKRINARSPGNRSEQQQR